MDYNIDINRDDILEKLEKAKINNVSTMMREINENVINNYLNSLEKNYSCIRTMLEKALSQNFNEVVENSALGNKDIKSVVDIIMKYYTDFCTNTSIQIGMQKVYPKLDEEKVLSICYRIIDIRFIEKLVEFSEKDWIEENYISDDFSVLTTKLDYTDLSNIEQFSIVMDIIRKNLATNLLSYSDLEQMNNIYLPFAEGQILGFNMKEIISLFSSDKVDEILSKNDSELTELESKQKILILESKKVSTKVSKDRIPKLIPYYKKLKVHYFDLLDGEGNLKNFTAQDFNEVAKSLKELGVTPKFSSMAAHLLKKEVKVVDEGSYHWQEKVDDKKELVTDREYKLIKKEIGKYFNLYTGMTERPLLEDEVLYCASLMLKIGEDESHIKTLFRRGIEKEKNPVARFIREYDKLKYYEERLLISNQIELMDQIVEEMFLCSNDEYRDWKNMLGIELQEVEYMLPNNYEYEIKKAKEYRKK